MLYPHHGVRVTGWFKVVYLEACMCPYRRAGAGLVGLGLSYALAITGLLNSALTSWAETEQEMVAVERILDYSCLAPQARRPDATPPPCFDGHLQLCK